MQEKLVIGMDFGTDSVRGLLVNAMTGDVRSTAVSYFKRWKQGLYCEPQKDQYRQHPLDYMESIDEVFHALLTGLSPETIKQIKAIGTNTTGSTPVAVDEQGQPLSLREGFSENPNAMFILWKDHTAIKDADEINALAKKWTIDYTRFSGGIYSSEWFWSKILHVNRVDPALANQAFTWVEQSDWIPTYLSGTTKVSAIKRNRCAAGHKAMWNESHGGLPSSEFLCSLDPSFYHLVHRFYTETYTSEQEFGTIAKVFVDRYGFDENTLITVGAIDAHHGAVGAGSEAYTLIKVIGTSTCDMLVVPKQDNPPLVEGICGQVDGSIDPGMIGFEAGQSAFGDIYNWFKKMMLKPVFEVQGLDLSDRQREVLENNFFAYITREAEAIPLTAEDMLFTDYHNGRRTPDADFTKVAAASGFTLATGAGHIFKALVEGTAFGSKAIIDRFRSYNIPIKAVIATGGIPNKAPYVVQVLADVLACDVQVVDSDQTCALGAVICAAVSAGVYPNIDDAKLKLAAKVSKTYHCNPERAAIYEKLYQAYKKLTQLEL
ncbi:ribulokinase [Sphingobacterium psychroaquaticum]|uniref:ribulokinase n=1 Tax=Sphingobacterium psychroaquaticum TaxID=561061 RepID=UPI00106B1C70|nr:ribulokinase [Sphingobacterium psychroaquaticum]QBQ40663.1 ribulokinase [Sphingobacterium psychroaquaticum]